MMFIPIYRLHEICNKQYSCRWLLLLTGLSLSIFNTVQAQTDDFDYSDKFEVEEVTFYSPSAANGNGWVRMKNDDNTLVSDAENYTIAWTWNDNEAITKPVTYVSGYHARIGSKIKINCEVEAENLYIKAVNSDGYNLPAEQVIFNSIEEIAYPPTGVENLFTDGEVDYFENFDLSWYLSTDPEAPDEDWILVGETNHELYVLYDTPLMIIADPLTGITQPFHTLIHLGCTNADGLNTPSAIVDAVYAEFDDQDVRSYGGTMPMTYWGPINTPQTDGLCWSTFGLLNFQDGRCDAWASFFDDILKMQGIEGVEKAVVDWGFTLSDDDVTRIMGDKDDFFGIELSQAMIEEYTHPFTGQEGYRAQFLVKEWSLNAEDKFAISFFDVFGDGFVLDNGNEIPAKDEIGLAGQGMDDPRPEFLSHAIVKYNGAYYDPSYGSQKMTSANMWENESLDAFAGIVVYTETFGGGFEVDRTLVWISALNNSTQQTNITP